jgi:hypothetical protein
MPIRVPFAFSPKYLISAISCTFLSTLLISTATMGQLPRKKVDKMHLPWIKFNWEGDSLANRYFDKLAITIPLKIDQLSYPFTAQLDLGAVNTMFYGKSLAPYLQLEPELGRKLDTTKRKAYENGTPCFFFYPINLTLDKVIFRDLSVENYSNFGDSLTIDAAKNPTPKLIGTIAPDLFQNKYLIIDYPNQRICLLDSLPGFIAKKTTFVPVKIRNGRIKIPITVGSEEHDIMFDTGSSIFSIYTSAENSLFFTGPDMPVTDTIIGQTWGQKTAIYGKKISARIRLGKHKMPPALVYYKIDEGEKKFEAEEKIIGLTGNAYFLKNIIIIDYRNKRFGVI